MSPLSKADSSETQVAPVSSPVAAVPDSPMVKASRPMTPEQLRELTSRLARGWNAVKRSKPATDDFPTEGMNSEMINTDRQRLQPLSGQGDLSDELYRWIAATLDRHGEKDSRSHADAAVQEFLDIPCSSRELLSFFRAFAAAYEKMVHHRCEIINSPRTSATSRITISQASGNHDITLRRLNRLAQMERDRPEAADIFRLWEFSGCSPEEIGRYLNLPADDVARRIENHSWDVYED